MTLICGLGTSFTGLKFPKPLLPDQKLTGSPSINYRKSYHIKISETRPQYFVRGGSGTKYAISVGRRNHELSAREEPFWLAPTKGFIRGLKFVFDFLKEQPSQLKYIEWPGFQNTLKTATLTLLVAMLIVVFSSVESGLWYLLALILRKPA